jgi:hypothetical protein
MALRVGRPGGRVADAQRRSARRSRPVWRSAHLCGLDTRFADSYGHEPAGRIRLSPARYGFAQNGGDSGTRSTDNASIDIYSKKEWSTVQRQGMYPRSVWVYSANSMQKIAGSSPAYFFFNGYMTDYTSMYAFVPVYTGMFICDNVIFLFMQVHNSMFLYVLVCTYTAISWPVCTSTYKYILVYTTDNTSTDTYIFDIIGEIGCVHPMRQESISSNVH